MCREDPSRRSRVRTRCGIGGRFPPSPLIPHSLRRRRWNGECVTWAVSTAPHVFELTCLLVTDGTYHSTDVSHTRPLSARRDHACGLRRSPITFPRLEYVRMYAKVSPNQQAMEILIRDPSFSLAVSRFSVRNLTSGFRSSRPTCRQEPRRRPADLQPRSAICLGRAGRGGFGPARTTYCMVFCCEDWRRRGQRPAPHHAL